MQIFKRFRLISAILRIEYQMKEIFSIILDSNGREWKNRSIDRYVLFDATMPKNALLSNFPSIIINNEKFCARSFPWQTLFGLFCVINALTKHTKHWTLSLAQSRWNQMNWNECFWWIPIKFDSWFFCLNVLFSCHLDGVLLLFCLA